MSQVLVWKSDIDGKLFEDKVEYQKHLRKLAAARQHQKKLDRCNQERETFLKNMGNVQTIEQLHQFIMFNWDWFYLNGLQSVSWKTISKYNKIPHKLVSLTLSKVRYSPTVSNTHVCPTNGGVTNWRGDRVLDNGEFAPRGYPGWTGSISFEIDSSYITDSGAKKQRSTFGADYFDGTLLKTGGGGGGRRDNGNESFRYDFSIFEADFPGLADTRSKLLLMKELGHQSIDALLI
mgnify:CR=1 FL=1